MLKLFWHCLDLSQSDEQFVEKSLCELTVLLQKPSVRIDVEMLRLRQDIIQGVEDVLRNPSLEEKEPFRQTIFTIRKKFSFSDWSPLLLYCKPNSSIASAAKKQDKNAIWGYMCDYKIAAVYRLNNKYILWHEVLHLFDVCDCYCYFNPNAGTNCDLTNCIMQYAPTPQTVGEWPFLCGKNIKRIRACNEKQTHN